MFAVSPPVADQLVPFAQWVASLPPSQRPKTAAYPMVNDPFADPMTQTAQGILQNVGIKTVYSKIYPAENPDYKAGADQVAASGAQLVVMGTVDVPTVSAFITAFQRQHYNPKILAATSGPDQGAAFLKAIGTQNATGIFVPNGWYAGLQNPLSQAFVRSYIAKYGGTPASAAAIDSLDRTLAAIEGQGGGFDGGAGRETSFARLNDDLGSLYAILQGADVVPTTQTVEGPAKYNNIGENVVASKFIFQWQHTAKFVQVLPAGAAGSVPIVNPRPDWGKG